MPTTSRSQGTGLRTVEAGPLPQAGSGGPWGQPRVVGRGLRPGWGLTCPSMWGDLSQADLSPGPRGCVYPQLSTGTRPGSLWHSLPLLSLPCSSGDAASQKPCQALRHCPLRFQPQDGPSRLCRAGRTLRPGLRVPRAGRYHLAAALLLRPMATNVLAGWARTHSVSHHGVPSSHTGAHTPAVPSCHWAAGEGTGAGEAGGDGRHGERTGRARGLDAEEPAGGQGDKAGGPSGGQVKGLGQVGGRAS